MTILKATALELKRSSFRLGPVDLAIEEGMAVGLIGPNGAGKTTLISCLLGLLRPDVGSIEMLNERVDYRTASWKQFIGVILDGQAHYERLTVDDNLQFHAQMKRTWDRELADRLIGRLDLSKSKRVLHLSRGERQKLSLITALSHRPKILVMDEPTSGVDPIVRAEVTDSIAGMMREEGTAVLIATHLISDVSRICDQVAFIQNGLVKQIVDKDSLLHSWRKVSFRFDGEVSNLPGALSHVMEGCMHLVTTSNIDSTMSKLKAIGATQIEVNRLPLEEIAVKVMKGSGQ